MSKFTHEEEKLLKLFQSEENRRSEEEFARIFTEKDYVKVAFINEDRAFTDGRNIVVDPAEDRLFTDREAIENTAEMLKIPAEKCTPWTALKLTTRSQNIHECLHIIFTAFPNPAVRNERSTTKARLITLCDIGNIIEDAYIEAVGASVYDNAEMFLKWGRISRLFVKSPSEGTSERRFKDAGVESTDAEKLLYILNYMVTELLYPMVKQPEPESGCKEYIEKVRPLFHKGASAPSPRERFKYSCEIFDVIEELIPDSEELLDRSYLCRILGGNETHSPFRVSPKPVVSEGREMAVTRMLFTDIDGNLTDGKDISEEFAVYAANAEKECRLALKDDESDGVIIIIQGSELDASAMHSGINIIENHPKPNKNMSKAYSNILKKYHASISVYNSRFEQLLKADREFFEDKQLFGNGISSKNIGDPKKRFWYRKATYQGIPDLVVLFMIDGSGSMMGERRNAAVISSVILHEVLSKQSIEHAFVEHRAVFGEPELDHNVLIDFNFKYNDKYNLMAINADEGTREGLSLFWAERYLARNSNAEKKLIIVISDGLPAHHCDGIAYYPPVSVMDTHNAAMKIIRRGTKIIALALGGSDGSCYDDLRQIYPEVIECSEPKKLTGQLLKVISREFR